MGEMEKVRVDLATPPSLELKSEAEVKAEALRTMGGVLEIDTHSNVTGGTSTDVTVRNTNATNKPWLFQKGSTLNPNGRPKNTMGAYIREVTQNGRVIVDKVMAILTSTQSPKIALHAAEFLRDTAFGRPIQNIEARVEGTDIGDQVLVQIQSFWSGIVSKNPNASPNAGTGQLEDRR